MVMQNQLFDQKTHLEEATNVWGLTWSKVVFGVANFYRKIAEVGYDIHKAAIFS